MAARQIGLTEQNHKSALCVGNIESFKKTKKSVQYCKKLVLLSITGALGKKTLTLNMVKEKMLKKKKMVTMNYEIWRDRLIVNS